VRLTEHLSEHVGDLVDVVGERSDGDGVLDLAKVAESSTIPPKTLSLVHLRASQINHCAVCVDIEIKRSAERETAQRLAAVAVWRENAVSDEVWAEAARHTTSRSSRRSCSTSRSPTCGTV
jgi:AhpD family alkylhydroperoxidase